MGSRVRLYENLVQFEEDFLRFRTPSPNRMIISIHDLRINVQMKMDPDHRQEIPDLVQAMANVGLENPNQ